MTGYQLFDERGAQRRPDPYQVDAKYRQALDDAVDQLGPDGVEEFLEFFRRQALADGADPALVAEVADDVETTAASR